MRELVCTRARVVCTDFYGVCTAFCRVCTDFDSVCTDWCRFRIDFCLFCTGLDRPCTDPGPLYTDAQLVDTVRGSSAPMAVVTIGAFVAIATAAMLAPHRSGGLQNAACI
jgi:hypothetical protein